MDQITDLLKAWNDGDEEAFGRLMQLVEPELKRTAHAYLANERPGCVLQTTALINEAFMKPFRKDEGFKNRGHFYGLIAKRMREVLIDVARKELAAKRGKRPQRIDMAESRYELSQELILLDQALSKLAVVDKRQAMIVECRYFIGLNREEIADLLGVAPITVDRDWKFARTWLKREIGGTSKLIDDA
ncbi:MAG TPA: ECF-type sigma factor [Pyrinomonadaceae bacterium]|nr:ECF-type sigma factor [Pyrinomonadaceae bacterium]